MSDLFIDDRPAPDKRIREFWVWIITELNGGEGIASADFQLEGFIPRHLPLQNSKREVAEGLRSVAERGAKRQMQATGRDVGLRLAHFVLADTTKELTAEDFEILVSALGVYRDRWAVGEGEELAGAVLEKIERIQAAAFPQVVETIAKQGKSDVGV